MAFSKATLVGAVDTIKEGWEKFNSLIDDLLSTSAGKGASQIGVQDSAGYFSAINVEDALAEEHAANVSAVALANIFAESSATTTGLTWGYTAGVLRNDNTLTSVSAGTIGLSDDATNYVELKLDGTMTTNTSSFTSGRLPIRQITTVAGEQTGSTDKRSFFPVRDVPLTVAQGGSGQSSYTNGQLLIGNTTGNTLAKATLTGTANQITITNSTGSITLSIPENLLIPTVLTVPNTGLHLLDTNASHDLIIKPGSDLTVDRILTLTTGDAARTISIAGNMTLAGALTTVGAVSISAFGATIIDDVDAAAVQTTLGVPPNARTISAGTGLSGGGSFSADRTISHTAHTGDVTGSTALTIGTGAVVEAKIGTGAVTNTKLGTSAVSQAKLKTTTAEHAIRLSYTTSNSDSKTEHITPTGAAYMFGSGAFKYVLISGAGANVPLSKGSHIYPSASALTTSYAYWEQHYASCGTGDDTGSIDVYARWNYVNSSGELVWYFVLIDKETREVLRQSLADNHPCFANSCDPAITPQPFGSYDPEKHNITCCVLTDDQWDHICDEAENYGDSKLHALTELYEINKLSNPAWPTKEVTVGLPKKIEVEVDGKKVMKPVDWRFMPAETDVNPIKKVIPKPDYVICKSLKKRVK